MASSFGWGSVGSPVQGTMAEDDAAGAVASSSGNREAMPSWATPPAQKPPPKADEGNGDGGSKGAGGGKADEGQGDKKKKKKDEKEPTQREIHVRMDDLSRREMAVKEREDYVKELERKLKDGGIEVKPKNWPKCKPILYHDISAEVPTPLQPLCKAGYSLWMLSVASYLFNFIAVCIMFFMGTASLACWFFSALATVIGVFCSWWTVYSGLYNAVKTSGHTWSYGKYFIHQAIFVGWAVWVFISPPIGSSSCFVAGLFVMIDQFSIGGGKGATGGVLGIINMVLWGLTLFLAVYVLLWAFTIWRKGGGLEQLQQQQQQAGRAAQVFGAVDNAADSVASKLFGGHS